MIEVNNYLYIPFKTEKKMKETIIKMIFDGDANKIVHTGSPKNLSVKKIKRLLYSNVSSRISPEDSRKEYNELINKSKFKSFCIFIKNSKPEKEIQEETYYQRNKERLRQYMKDYYHNNNRKEYFREYYRKNKLKINEL